MDTQKLSYSLSSITLAYITVSNYIVSLSCFLFISITGEPTPWHRDSVRILCYKLLYGSEKWSQWLFVEGVKYEWTDDHSMRRPRTCVSKPAQSTLGTLIPPLTRGGVSMPPFHWPNKAQLFGITNCKPLILVDWQVLCCKRFYSVILRNRRNSSDFKTLPKSPSLKKQTRPKSQLRETIPAGSHPILCFTMAAGSGEGMG